MAPTLSTNINETLGAAFIGFAVSSILYGVLSTQIHSYFQRYSLDRPLYKNMVIFVWLLETLHQALTGHTVYYYTISNYNNPIALLFPVWTVIVQVLIAAVISVIVKSAFAMRVWRFSNHNIFLTGTIAALNCAILGLAVAFTVLAFRIQTFLELPKLKVVTSVILGVSVLTDLIIAASLTYYLHHLRSGYSANTIVNGLIRYSIETGAITSICGIATLIAFNIVPSTFVYMAFFFVLSKLYSNSLLATLNTRRVIRGRGTDRGPGNNEEFTIIQTNGHLQTTHSIFGQVDWQKQPTDIEVNVLQEVISVPSEQQETFGPYGNYDQSRSRQSIRLPGYVNTVDRLREPERVARF